MKRRKILLILTAFSFLFFLQSYNKTHAQTDESLENINSSISAGLQEDTLTTNSPPITGFCGDFTAEFLFTAAFKNI